MSRLPETVTLELKAHLAAGLSDREIARRTRLARSTIRKIRINYNIYNQPYAPRTVKQGRPRVVDLVHEDVSPFLGAELYTNYLQALLLYLTERPTAYLDELASWMLDTYNLRISTSSIHRILKRRSWSRKAAGKQVAERDAALRAI